MFSYVQEIEPYQLMVFCGYFIFYGVEQEEFLKCVGFHNSFVYKSYKYAAKNCLFVYILTTVKLEKIGRLNFFKLIFAKILTLL